jgi:hypothetical protein
MLMEIMNGSFSNEVFDPEMSDFMYSLGGETEAEEENTNLKNKKRVQVSGLGRIGERPESGAIPRPMAREQVLQEAKPTNYSGVCPPCSDILRGP